MNECSTLMEIHFVVQQKEQVKSTKFSMHRIVIDNNNCDEGEVTNYPEIYSHQSSHHHP